MMGCRGIYGGVIRLLLALLAGLAAVYVGSCATPAGPGRISPKAVAPQAKPAPEHAFDADAVLKTAQQDIERGMYEEALNVYRQSINAHPGNRKLDAAYDSGLMEIRKAADSAFEKKAFSAAGGLYLLVDKNINLSHAAGPEETGYLKDRIKSCARKLTEMGLVSYRKGDLPGAISLWRDVLKFDPGNAEVRKALETAKVQLKNLSK
ncbi:MAG: hypothetical protein M0033_07445 [Nitrospiraceae bacterium]|nr:hypothetical protein [Nitrospiraceae bacterium]